MWLKITNELTEPNNGRNHYDNINQLINSFLIN